MTFLRKIIFINLFIGLLFLFDRIAKIFAFNLPESGFYLAGALSEGGLRLAEAPHLRGIGGFFLFSKKFIGLQLYKNYHLIFNLEIMPLLFYFFISLTLLIILALLAKNYLTRNTFLIFSFSLILIGAISNLIDRLLYGYVIDFLSFFDYSIFNLADVYIFVGAGLILIRLTTNNKRRASLRQTTIDDTNFKL